MRRAHPDLSARTRQLARPLTTGSDLSPLIHDISQKRVVMLGEASHGTHEFYEWRSTISQELIEKHGYRFIAVEGDWPPCQQLNRYVRTCEGGTARRVLEHFHRWPTWMWANEEIIGLAEWMRDYNMKRPEEQRVGFHGLDVYSLFESIEAAIQQLDRINPFLARRARNRYACFDRFSGDEKQYARSLLRYPEGCERQVLDNLKELLAFRIDGLKDREDALFDARQNARIVKNAEDYYRTMVLGTEDSWNVRDRHMMETLDILLDHYGSRSKGIVWEHNTHIGDYRATDMLRMGQINLGGLAREQLGEQAVSLVGFGTYRGTVIASRSWDGPIEVLDVPPAREETYEAIFHEVAQAMGQQQFYLQLVKENLDSPLFDILGHRAIGVVYDPAHERWGNYAPTSLAKRYDAFIFIDETRALSPLKIGFDRNELPDTWPMGQ